jgi:hypothetical protein
MRSQDLVPSPAVPRRRAVVVSLNGGLGNQLFQYCAGLHLARAAGAELHPIENRPVGTRALGAVDVVDAPTGSLSERERFICGLRSSTLRRLPAGLRQSARALARRTSHYREIYQSLLQMADPAVAISEQDQLVHLRGLFQHPSYYDDVLDDVVTSMLRKLSSRLDLPDGDGVAAVHFRRGDYVLHGFDLPFSFQANAVAEIAARHELTRVVVMSDDEEFALLAAEHFLRCGLAAVATTGSERAELDDLAALACAQHLVMSNSTFVWWAAVLGDRLRQGRTDRVVVCPTPWMPMSAADNIPSATLDLSRPGWLMHSVRA